MSPSIANCRPPVSRRGLSHLPLPVQLHLPLPVQFLERRPTTTIVLAARPRWSSTRSRAADDHGEPVVSGAPIDRTMRGHPSGDDCITTNTSDSAAVPPRTWASRRMSKSSSPSPSMSVLAFHLGSEGRVPVTKLAVAVGRGTRHRAGARGRLPHELLERLIPWKRGSWASLGGRALSRTLYLGY